MMTASLPIPTTDALSISQELLKHILSQININQGKIPFAHYMNLALYTPNLGYYASPVPKFGRKGDFITAPEISSLFSQCLANQCLQILNHLPNSDILEMGAGTGKMAADILSSLAKTNALPKHYFILELSAYLKNWQEETLRARCPELLNRVVWLNTLPKHFRGIILANEVLDAMPIHRFQILENVVYDTHVSEQAGQLIYDYVPTENLLLKTLHQSQSWPLSYTSEINLNLEPWIASLSDILDMGIILLIDYGFPKHEYYHPQRSMGTLMCHYQHHAHGDPFFYPGLQDITAHVDFTAVAEAALNSNLLVLGYTHQAAFLLESGLPQLLIQKQFATEKEKVAEHHAVHLLTSPAEMGELFKVMALGRNVELPLLGFKTDRRHAL